MERFAQLGSGGFQPIHCSLVNQHRGRAFCLDTVFLFGHFKYGVQSMFPRSHPQFVYDNPSIIRCTDS